MTSTIDPAAPSTESKELPHFSPPCENSMKKNAIASLSVSGEKRAGEIELMGKYRHRLSPRDFAARRSLAAGSMAPCAVDAQ